MSMGIIDDDLSSLSSEAVALVAVLASRRSRLAADVSCVHVRS